jgi:hypothetical protein
MATENTMGKVKARVPQLLVIEAREEDIHLQIKIQCSSTSKRIRDDVYVASL